MPPIIPDDGNTVSHAWINGGAIVDTQGFTSRLFVETQDGIVRDGFGNSLPVRVFDGHTWLDVSPIVLVP